MNLLRYRPPLVTYRVVKARRITPYQAQYLARKARGFGSRHGNDLSGRGARARTGRQAIEVLALLGLATAAVVVLMMLALLTWITAEMITAIL